MLKLILSGNAKLALIIPMANVPQMCGVKTERVIDQLMTS